MKIPIFILYAFGLIYFNTVEAIRLSKLFSYIDGITSDYHLRGFLHIGMDYAVFLRLPKAHDKILTFELYDAKNVLELKNYKPKLLAISEIPVQYLKDQLKIFKKELHKAKYFNNGVVPGTEVKTLREWQIDKALDKQSKMKPVLILSNAEKVLRTVV